MNKIPKLDEAENIIGETTSREAVTNGWWRLVSRVFLFDQNGRMLLQKRSPNMFTFPNLWDQSAAGHIDVGENSEQAAYRELNEELGISGVPLRLIVDSFRNEFGTNRTIDAVYKGIIDFDENMSFDDGEVTEVKWFTIDEFEKSLVDHPEIFVPPFVRIWENFKEKLVE